MKFDNVEDAVNAIIKANETIKLANAFIKENDITEKDIEKGLIFESASSKIIVIPISTGYRTGLYYFGGLFGETDPLTPYSNEPMCKKEMIKYLKDSGYRKTGRKIGVIQG